MQFDGWTNKKFAPWEKWVTGQNTQEVFCSGAITFHLQGKLEQCNWFLIHLQEMTTKPKRRWAMEFKPLTSCTVLGIHYWLCCLWLGAIFRLLLLIVASMLWVVNWQFWSNAEGVLLSGAWNQIAEWQRMSYTLVLLCSLWPPWITFHLDEKWLCLASEERKTSRYSQTSSLILQSLFFLSQSGHF